MGVALLTAALTMTAVAWPGWATDRLPALLITLVVAAGGIWAAMRLLRRARVWAVGRTRAAELAVSGAARKSRGRSAKPPRSAPVGVPAQIGNPLPLHRSRPGQPIRRRHSALVVPITAELPGLAGGRSLTVHGRSDRIELAAGDPVEVVSLAGPKGPFLLYRPGDGAVFAADWSPLAAW